MKLLLNDEIKVEGTLEELLDFLKEYKKLTKDEPKIEPPRITTNPDVWRDPSSCEGCPIHERLKNGEIVIDDSCYWCSKNPCKITCTAYSNVSNNPNKQPFDEYASGLTVREAMTGVKHK